MPQATKLSPSTLPDGFDASIDAGMQQHRANGRSISLRRGSLAYESPTNSSIAPIAKQAKERVSTHSRDRRIFSAAISG